MGEGSGGNATDGERWGVADEASLAGLLLTSCCVAWLLTGRGPVPVRGLEVGDRCYRMCLRGKMLSRVPGLNPTSTSDWLCDLGKFLIFSVPLLPLL